MTRSGSSFSNHAVELAFDGASAQNQADRDVPFPATREAQGILHPGQVAEKKASGKFGSVSLWTQP